MRRPCALIVLHAAITVCKCTNSRPEPGASPPGGAVDMIRHYQPESVAKKEAGTDAADDLTDADKAIIQPITDSLPRCVNSVQRARFWAVLVKHHRVFSRHEFDTGTTDLIECRLELKDPSLPPVAEPLRAHPIVYLDAIDQEVSKMEAAGVVVPCNSTWAGNLVVIPKKDLGDGKIRLRVALDARKINARLHRLAYPMPRVDYVFQSLRNKQYFHFFDLAGAYLGIKLSQDTNYITAFTTRRGMYKFVKMVPGLHSAGSVYNRLIQEHVFRDMLWDQLAVFVDDLAAGTRTIDEGILLIDEILGRISRAGLKVKAQKCFLFQLQARILGHVVTENEIKEDPARCEVIRKMPYPKPVTEIRRALGFFNFARVFYKNFAEAAAQLYACLKKGAGVIDTPETRQAFDRLREMMCNGPGLAIFNPQARETWLEVDASKFAIGSAIFQVEENGTKRAVAYFSKCFTPRQQAMCTTARELSAIVESLLHWRSLLLGRPIKVLSDHCCLKYLYTCKNLSPQWARQYEKICEFDIDIQWTPGKLQSTSDFLSRLRPCEDPDNEPCAICRPYGPRDGRPARRHTVARTRAFGRAKRVGHGKDHTAVYVGIGTWRNAAMHSGTGSSERRKPEADAVWNRWCLGPARRTGESQTDCWTRKNHGKQRVDST
jgi:hypothetical protein